MINSPPSSSEPGGDSSSFALLDEPVKRWVWQRGWQDLRDIQEEAIPPILSRQSDLIIAAATAAGKTEAAFLPICSSLIAEPIASGIGALYISPLKALINDQRQRLEQLCETAEIELNSWHGDIGAGVKRRVREHSQGVLMITPESLESIFVNHGTSAPAIFGALRYVVIDELHAFIGSERGAQLRSLLHRIELAGRRRSMRIGLSATLGEMRTAAEFMRPGDGESVALIESKADPRELRVQLRGYLARGMQAASANTAESVELAETDRLEIAEHLFAQLRGADNLVFADSRKNVEVFADLLRRRCEEQRVPNEFFPHHGSLSKSLREEVEQRLRERSKPTTAICTSTLELGIDVGSVKCVGQVDPPFSAAALRQRLGRSGRKPADPSILRMYVTESELEPGARPEDELREGLVQSIALVEALVDGWFEPPVDGALHVSTLVQQLLSVIAQHGGALADDIWGALCGSGPFDLDRQSFVLLLRGLAERDVIQQSGDGELILAPRGEQIVSHYSFYSAFVTSVEYRLLADSTEIGTMPITSPLSEGALLIFGGRRWRVLAVDDERKMISVAPAKAGKVPRFIGSGGDIHDEIRQRMREIYESDSEPIFLDKQAQALLKQGRDGFAQLNLDRRQIVDFDSGSAYFPWRGDRVVATLALGIRSAGHHVEAQGLAILAPDTPPVQLREVLNQVFGARADPDPVRLAGTVKNLETEKHHWLVDPELLLRDCAVARLDTAGAKLAVNELATTASQPAPISSSSAAIKFVVVDCETTGLHPSAHHRIVELALITVDASGEPIERWSSLLQPERDLGATAIHGIHGRELRDAPSFDEVLGEVRDRLAGRVIVAHNARFDRAFLEHELARNGIELAPLPTLCTMELASRLAIGGTRRRLQDCCNSLDVELDGAHSALADAEACRAVLAAYLEEFGAGVTAQISGRPRAAEDWPKSERRAKAVQRTPRTKEILDGPLADLVARMPLPEVDLDQDSSAYLEVLDRAIEDRRLDDEEQAELAATAAMLGITETQQQHLHRDYLGALVELAWRDEQVTEREREDLLSVAEALGITDLTERLGTPARGRGRPDETAPDLKGKTVCFTGALTCRYQGNPMTRALAENLARGAGLTVLPRVTKKLEVLVVVDPETMSGKARKAREYGTRVIAESAFWEMIGVEVS